MDSQCDTAPFWHRSQLSPSGQESSVDARGCEVLGSCGFRGPVSNTILVDSQGQHFRGRSIQRTSYRLSVRWELVLVGIVGGRGVFEAAEGLCQALSAVACVRVTGRWRSISNLFSAVTTASPSVSLRLASLRALAATGASSYTSTATDGCWPKTPPKRTISSRSFQLKSLHAGTTCNPHTEGCICTRWLLMLLAERHKVPCLKEILWTTL